MSRYIGRSPQIGGYHKLDAITTDGSASYTMQLDSANFTPESANHLIVSVNGVIQAPTDSFTVSGSTITFASSLSVSDTIDFIMALGNVLDIGTPSDGTISASKLATTSITGQTAETSANDSDSLLIYDDSATALRKMTRGNFLSGVGGTNTPAFVAYLDANQGVSDNTHTKLTVTNEAFDTDNAFASSTFTVPSGKAGKYLFVGKARMVNTVGYIVLDFYKNGSNAGIHFRSQSYSTTYESVTITAILDLSVGDYIELYGLQSSGSPNDITGKVFQGFKLL